MYSGETVLSGADSSKEDSHISELKVMHSPAGYYIGTEFRYCGNCSKCIKEGGTHVWEEPNSRETDYFKTQEDAQAALDKLNKTGDLPEKRSSEFVPPEKPHT